MTEPISDPRTVAEQRRSAYVRWLDAQPVPVHRAFSIPDLFALEVGPWPSLGAKGAAIILEGCEELNGAYLGELGGGEATSVQKHFYEEVVYFASGKGSSTIWVGEHRHDVYWTPGSLLAIPLNARYQHVNLGDEAARFYSVTTAPIMMNLIADQAFIEGGSDAVFSSRVTDQPDPYGEGIQYEIGGRRIYDTGFVPNVKELALVDWSARGAGGTNAMLEMVNSALAAHVSQFPVGMYKKAHRHNGGANVIILSGQGFSLLWKEGDEPQRVDWKPGSVLVPPDQWFHQHFNTGSTPARYLAIRWGARKHKVFKPFEVDKSMALGGDQIEYEDQEPWIDEMYAAELDKVGVASSMPHMQKKSEDNS